MSDGTVTLRLQLDREQFDRDLQDLQEQGLPSLRLPITVDTLQLQERLSQIGVVPLSLRAEIDRQSLRAVKQQIKDAGLKKVKLELHPEVDHKPLKKLNEHLDLKVKHVKEVNRYFREHPLTPAIDATGLQRLNQQLDRVRSHLHDLRTSQQFTIAAFRELSAVQMKVDRVSAKALVVRHLHTVEIQNLRLERRLDQFVDDLETVLKRMRGGGLSASLMRGAGSVLMGAGRLGLGALSLPFRAVGGLLGGATSAIGTTLSMAIGQTLGTQIEKGLSGATKSGIQAVVLDIDRYLKQRFRRTTPAVAQFFGYSSLEDLQGDLRRVAKYFDEWLDPETFVKRIDQVELNLAKFFDQIISFNNWTGAFKGAFDTHLADPVKRQFERFQQMSQVMTATSDADKRKVGERLVYGGADTFLKAPLQERQQAFIRSMQKGISVQEREFIVPYVQFYQGLTQGLTQGRFKKMLSLTPEQQQQATVAQEFAKFYSQLQNETFRRQITRSDLVQRVLRGNLSAENIERNAEKLFVASRQDLFGQFTVEDTPIIDAYGQNVRELLESLQDQVVEQLKNNKRFVAAQQHFNKMESAYGKLMAEAGVEDPRQLRQALTAKRAGEGKTLSKSELATISFIEKLQSNPRLQAAYGLVQPSEDAALMLREIVSQRGVVLKGIEALGRRKIPGKSRLPGFEEIVGDRTEQVFYEAFSKPVEGGTTLQETATIPLGLTRALRAMFNVAGAATSLKKRIQIVASGREAEQLSEQLVFEIPKKGTVPAIGFAVGGRQFKGGEGSREMAEFMKAMFPDVYTIPVENPKTDLPASWEARKRMMEQDPILNLIKQFAPDLAKNEELGNTITNAAFTLKKAFFEPRDEDAEKLAAYIIAAIKEGYSPEQLGAMSFSFGGLNVMNAMAILKDLGYTDVRGLATAYPMFGLQMRNLEQFKASILKADPLTFGFLTQIMGVPPETVLMEPSAKQFTPDQHSTMHWMESKQSAELLQWLFKDYYRPIETGGQVKPALVAQTLYRGYNTRRIIDVLKAALEGKDISQQIERYDEELVNDTVLRMGENPATFFNELMDFLNKSSLLDVTNPKNRGLLDFLSQQKDLRQYEQLLRAIDLVLQSREVFNIYSEKLYGSAMGTPVGAIPDVSDVLQKVNQESLKLGRNKEFMGGRLTPDVGEWTFYSPDAQVQQSRLQDLDKTIAYYRSLASDQWVSQVPEVVGKLNELVAYLQGLKAQLETKLQIPDYQFSEAFINQVPPYFTEQEITDLRQRMAAPRLDELNYYPDEAKKRISALVEEVQRQQPAMLSTKEALMSATQRPLSYQEVASTFIGNTQERKGRLEELDRIINRLETAQKDPWLAPVPKTQQALKQYLDYVRQIRQEIEALGDADLTQTTASIGDVLKTMEMPAIATPEFPTFDYVLPPEAQIPASKQAGIIFVVSKMQDEVSKLTAIQRAMRENRADIEGNWLYHPDDLNRTQQHLETDIPKMIAYFRDNVFRKSYFEGFEGGDLFQAIANDFMAFVEDMAKELRKKVQNPNYQFSQEFLNRPLRVPEMPNQPVFLGADNSLAVMKGVERMVPALEDLVLMYVKAGGDVNDALKDVTSNIIEGASFVLESMQTWRQQHSREDWQELGKIYERPEMARPYNELVAKLGSKAPLPTQVELMARGFAGGTAFLTATEAYKISAGSGNPSELAAYARGGGLVMPRVLDAGEGYIVTERLPGKAIKRRFEAGEISRSEMISQITELGRLQAQMHRLGIVHNDLAPSNVFMTPWGAKAIDMELAKTRDTMTEEEWEAAVQKDIETTRGRLIADTKLWLEPDNLIQSARNLAQLLINFERGISSTRQPTPLPEIGKPPVETGAKPIELGREPIPTTPIEELEVMKVIRGIREEQYRQYLSQFAKPISEETQSVLQKFDVGEFGAPPEDATIKELEAKRKSIQLAIDQLSSESEKIKSGIEELKTEIQKFSDVSDESWTSIVAAAKSNFEALQTSLARVKEAKTQLESIQFEYEQLIEKKTPRPFQDVSVAAIPEVFEQPITSVELPLMGPMPLNPKMLLTAMIAGLDEEPLIQGATIKINEKLVAAGLPPISRFSDLSTTQLQGIAIEDLKEVGAAIVKVVQSVQNFVQQLQNRPALAAGQEGEQKALEGAPAVENRGIPVFGDPAVKAAISRFAATPVGKALEANIQKRMAESGVRDVIALENLTVQDLAAVGMHDVVESLKALAQGIAMAGKTAAKTGEAFIALESAEKKVLDAIDKHTKINPYLAKTVLQGVGASVFMATPAGQAVVSALGGLVGSEEIAAAIAGKIIQMTGAEALVSTGASLTAAAGTPVVGGAIGTMGGAVSGAGAALIHAAEVIAGALTQLGLTIGGAGATFIALKGVDDVTKTGLTVAAISKELKGSESPAALPPATEKKEAEEALMLPPAQESVKTPLRLSIPQKEAIVITEMGTEFPVRSFKESTKRAISEYRATIKSIAEEIQSAETINPVLEKLEQLRTGLTSSGSFQEIKTARDALKKKNSQITVGVIDASQMAVMGLGIYSREKKLIEAAKSQGVIEGEEYGATLGTFATQLKPSIDLIKNVFAVAKRQLAEGGESAEIAKLAIGRLIAALNSEAVALKGAGGNTAKNLVQAVKSGLQGLDESTIIQGLIKGLSEGNTQEIGEEQAAGFLKGFKDRLGIRSPSQEMIKEALNILRGLIKGLDPQKLREIGKQAAEALHEGMVEVLLAGQAPINAAVRPMFESLIAARREARLNALNRSAIQAEQLSGQIPVPFSGQKPIVIAMGGLMGARGLAGRYWQNDLDVLGITQSAEVVYPTYEHTDGSRPWRDRLGFGYTAYRQINRNHLLGQNPDAIKVAALALAARKAYPDVPIQLLGHSAGADVVNEAMAILDRVGIPKVKGTGVAGVDYGAQPPAQRYINLPGERDWLLRFLGFIGAKRSLPDFGRMTNTFVHGIEGYRNHPRFINELIPELQPVAAMNALRSFLKEFEQAIASGFNQVLQDAEEFVNHFPHIFDQRFESAAALANVMEAQGIPVGKSPRVNVGTLVEQIHGNALQPKDIDSIQGVTIELLAQLGAIARSSGQLKSLKGGNIASDISAGLEQGNFQRIGQENALQYQEGFKNQMEIRSPSGWMKWAGKMLGLGLKEGIEPEIEAIQESVEAVKERVEQSVQAVDVVPQQLSIFDALPPVQVTEQPELVGILALAQAGQIMSAKEMLELGMVDELTPPSKEPIRRIQALPPAQEYPLLESSEPFAQSEKETTLSERELRRAQKAAQESVTLSPRVGAIITPTTEDPLRMSQYLDEQIANAQQRLELTLGVLKGLIQGNEQIQETLALPPAKEIEYNPLITPETPLELPTENRFVATPFGIVDVSRPPSVIPTEVSQALMRQQMIDRQMQQEAAYLTKGAVVPELFVRPLGIHVRGRRLLPPGQDYPYEPLTTPEEPFVLPSSGQVFYASPEGLIQGLNLLPPYQGMWRLEEVAKRRQEQRQQEAFKPQGEPQQEVFKPQEQPLPMVAPTEIPVETIQEEQEPKQGFWQRVKRFFGIKKSAREEVIAEPQPLVEIPVVEPVEKPIKEEVVEAVAPKASTEVIQVPVKSEDVSKFEDNLFNAIFGQQGQDTLMQVEVIEATEKLRREKEREELLRSEPTAFKLLPPAKEYPYEPIITPETPFELPQSERTFFAAPDALIPVNNAILNAIQTEQLTLDLGDLATSVEQEIEAIEPPALEVPIEINAEEFGRQLSLLNEDQSLNAAVAKEVRLINEVAEQMSLLEFTPEQTMTPEEYREWVSRTQQLQGIRPNYEVTALAPYEPAGGLMPLNQLDEGVQRFLNRLEELNRIPDVEFTSQEIPLLMPAQQPAVAGLLPEAGAGDRVITAAPSREFMEEFNQWVGQIMSTPVLLPEGQGLSEKVPLEIGLALQSQQEAIAQQVLALLKEQQDKFQQWLSAMKAPLMLPPAKEPNIPAPDSSLILSGQQPVEVKELILPGQQPLEVKDLILPGQQPLEVKELILPGQQPVEIKELILPNQQMDLPTPLLDQYGNEIGKQKELVLPTKEEVQKIEVGSEEQRRRQEYAELMELKEEERSIREAVEKRIQEEMQKEAQYRALAKERSKLTVEQLREERKGIKNVAQVTEEAKKAAKGMEEQQKRTWNAEGLGNYIKSLGTSFMNFLRESGDLGNFLADALINVRNALVGIFVGYSMQYTIERFIGYLQKAYQTAVEFNRLEVGLKFALKGSFAQGMQFVESLSQRLGTPFLESARGYQSMAAATRGGVLEGSATEEIFTAVSEAAAILGLSGPDTSLALTAVQQIISKGRVSAEELRQQLAERLPGAFQIAARAMGVTEQELNKMLERGELLSSVFIPRFARQLRMEMAGSLDDAANSTQGVINRFENAKIALERAFGEAIAPFANAGLKGATIALNLIADNLGIVSSLLGGTIVAAMGTIWSITGRLFPELLSKLQAVIYGTVSWKSALQGVALGMGKVAAILALIQGVGSAVNTLQTMGGNEATVALRKNNERLRKQLEEERNQRVGDKPWLLKGMAGFGGFLVGSVAGQRTADKFESAANLFGFAVNKLLNFLSAPERGELARQGALEAGQALLSLDIKGLMQGIGKMTAAANPLRNPKSSFGDDNSIVGLMGRIEQMTGNIPVLNVLTRGITFNPVNIAFGGIVDTLTGLAPTKEQMEARAEAIELGNMEDLLAQPFSDVINIINKARTGAKLTQEEQDLTRQRAGMLMSTAERLEAAASQARDAARVEEADLYDKQAATLRRVAEEALKSVDALQKFVDKLQELQLELRKMENEELGRQVELTTALNEGRISERDFNNAMIASQEELLTGRIAKNQAYLKSLQEFMNSEEFEKMQQSEKDRLIQQALDTEKQILQDQLQLQQLKNQRIEQEIQLLDKQAGYYRNEVELRKSLLRLEAERQRFAGNLTPEEYEQKIAEAEIDAIDNQIKGLKTQKEELQKLLRETRNPILVDRIKDQLVQLDTQLANAEIQKLTTQMEAQNKILDARVNIRRQELELLNRQLETSNRLTESMQGYLSNVKEALGSLRQMATTGIRGILEANRTGNPNVRMGEREQRLRDRLLNQRIAAANARQLGLIGRNSLDAAINGMPLITLYKAIFEQERRNFAEKRRLLEIEQQLQRQILELQLKRSRLELEQQRLEQQQRYEQAVIQGDTIGAEYAQKQLALLEELILVTEQSGQLQQLGQSLQEQAQRRQLERERLDQFIQTSREVAQDPNLRPRTVQYLFERYRYRPEEPMARGETLPLTRAGAEMNRQTDNQLDMVTQVLAANADRLAQLQQRIEQFVQVNATPIVQPQPQTKVDNITITLNNTFQNTQQGVAQVERQLTDALDRVLKGAAARL